MEDLKQSFINAGFAQTQKEYLLMKHGLVDLFVGMADSCCYFSSSVEGEQVVRACKFETLEELNKLCYGYLLRDLDFQPRKDYSWSECYSLKGGFYVGNTSEIEIACDTHSVPSGNKNVFRTEEQARSALAYSQLTQIIDEINNDYPTDGPIVYLRRNGNKVITSNLPSLIGLHSTNGGAKLLETNFQLLQDYFMIKTETNERCID